MGNMTSCVVKFRFIAGCAALLTALACLWPVRLLHAQPISDESWVAVSVVDAGGKPCPVAPTVTLYRLVGKRRVYSGRPILSVGNTTCIIGLTAGTFETHLQLVPYGLYDGPKTIELLPGPNSFEWRLPRVAPVGGALQLSEAMKATPPGRTMAYLQSVGKSGALPAQCSLAKDRLLIMTDQGFGLTTFTITQDQKDPVDAPVTLSAGGVAAFEVNIPAAGGNTAPVPGATITLSSPVDKGFTPTISLRTEKDGEIGTPALPPGTWNWTIYAPGYPQKTGAVTVAAGATQTVTVTLGAG